MGSGCSRKRLDHWDPGYRSTLGVATVTPVNGRSLQSPVSSFDSHELRRSDFGTSNRRQLFQRSTLSHLIRGPFYNRLSSSDLSTHRDFFSSGNTLANIDPMSMTIDCSYDEGSRGGCYNACRRNKQKLFSTANGPIYRWVHPRSQTAVRIDKAPTADRYELSWSCILLCCSVT
jgi:hypothetical protein